MKLDRTTGSSSFTRSSSPTRAYNRQASLHVASSAATTYLWFSLTGLPANATITSATLTVRQNGAWPSATRDLVVRAVKAWAYSTLRNNKKPAPFGPAATVRKTGATPTRTAWAIPVTELVQAMLVPGQSRGYFSINTNESAIRYLLGFSAASGRPTLSITYEVQTPAPTNLTPTGGAISTRTPALTWGAADGQTQSQVQIAATPAFAAALYDSNLQPNTDDRWPLAGTGYQLPADGTHVWARTRVVGSGGLSAWSSPAELWYAALPTVAVDDPLDVVTDSSPTITWTAPVQASWRARLLQAGREVWSSGWLTGSQKAVTPATGIAPAGGPGVAAVDVADTIVRVPAEGAPTYATATKQFTFNAAAGVPPVTDLQVSSGPHTPWTPMKWRRTEIPDEWGILRDDIMIARFAGTDLTPDASDRYTWTDYTAAPFTEHEYRVVPIPNRSIPADGPRRLITPHVRGLWLCDPESGVDVVLFGRDEIDASSEDPVATSSPLDVPETLVRQGLPRLPTHPVAGYLANGLGRDADDMKAVLEEWRETPRLLRLSYGGINVPAVVHSIQIATVRAGISPGTKRWKVTATAVQQRETL